MAKITRVLQKIFGNSAATGEFGAIGSKASGSPTTTKNLDSMQSDPKYLEGLFGITSDQGSSRLPYSEDINSLFFLLTSMVKYLFQSGVPEWLNTENYYNRGSIALDEGVLWRSISGTDISPNINNKPKDNLDKWKPLTYPLNPIWFGAIGDGVTNDSVIVNAVIAASEKEIFIEDVFYVPSLVNLNGIKIIGPGKLLENVIGGTSQSNSEKDNFKYVFGQEYMSHFHQGYIDGWGQAPVAVFSGDSTTEGIGGSGITDPTYTINNLFKNSAFRLGMNTQYGLASLNSGHAGSPSADWLSTFLAQDLALNPDIYFLRWGINDGSAADRDTFYANMRAGLAEIRTTQGLGIEDLTIVLMSPNSTNDEPNGRAATWHESISLGIKEIAREFQCVYIDTYAYLRDSKGAANIYMDDPFGDGRTVHPHEVMNLWISSIITDTVFPYSLTAKLGQNSFQVTGGNEQVIDVTFPPNSFIKGLSYGRCDGGSGFPLDGIVEIKHHVDGIVVQNNYPYLPANTNTFAWRFGDTNTGVWSDWRWSGGSSVFPTAAANFTLSAANFASLKARREGVLCSVEGYILKDALTTVAQNEVIATLPVGYRPVCDDALPVSGIAYTGAFYFPIMLTIDSLGVIKSGETTTLQVTRIAINATYSVIAYNK